jgi:ABC-2 type transport system ATP-binding protein
MLRVENLNFNYGPRKVLEGLSFSIDKGKLVGFLGPNGAGKTTTMNLITGLYYSTEGDIFVNDQSISKNPLLVKKRIGFLPEQAPLYMDMTVVDYLSFVASLKGVSTKNLMSYVKTAIEKTNLSEVESRLIARLSKGYRQRVGLAQAIVAKPDLIVLDEPTVGFDPQQVNEFKKLLVSLKGEHTVLWSTHILADVEDTCDEVVVINQGKIVMQGVPKQISQSSRGERQLRLKVRNATEAFREKLSLLSGVKQVQLDVGQSSYFLTCTGDEVIDAVLALAAQERVGVLQVENDRRSLQDLFLELTQKTQGEKA